MPTKRRPPRGVARKAKARAARTALRTQQAQQRSLEGLHLMRGRSLSFARAAREAGTTPRTMRRYVGTALKTDPRGRIVATTFDRIPRTIKFITPEGVIDLTVRDSRTASRVARHLAAVHRYLITGNARGLRAFWGKSVRTGKVGFPFVVDRKTLERLAAAGELSFEDLYSLTTGETK